MVFQSNSFSSRPRAANGSRSTVLLARNLPSIPGTVAAVSSSKTTLPQGKTPKTVQTTLQNLPQSTAQHQFVSALPSATREANTTQLGFEKHSPFKTNSKTKSTQSAVLASKPSTSASATNANSSDPLAGLPPQFSSLHGQMSLKDSIATSSPFVTKGATTSPKFTPPASWTAPAAQGLLVSAGEPKADRHVGTNYNGQQPGSAKPPSKPAKKRSKKGLIAVTAVAALILAVWFTPGSTWRSVEKNILALWDAQSGQQPADQQAQTGGRVAGATTDGKVKGLTTEFPNSQRLVISLPTVFRQAVVMTTATIQDLLNIEGDVNVGGNLAVEGDSELQGETTVGGPATFEDTVNIAGEVTLESDVNGDGITIDVGGGRVLASNLVYSVAAGDGISSSGGQNPVISNTDRGSAQKIFGKIIVDTTELSASNNTDSFTLLSGTGVSLSADPTTKEITIDVNGGAVNVSGWVETGNIVHLLDDADNVAIGTDTPTAGSKLTVLGNGDVTGNFAVSGLTSSGTLAVGKSSVTSGSVFSVLGNGDVDGDFYITGTLTVDGGSIVSGGIDNQSGGIVNAGAITGATGLTSSGTITFSGLSTGIVKSDIAGVLSSSAVDLASADVTGILGPTNGGTGLNSYALGDILYSTGANTLGKLGIGAPNQVLTVSGGVPVWGNIDGDGGLCPTCVVMDPGSSQIITPSDPSATGLSIRQASGGTVDIFNVANNDGSTKYLTVDYQGNVILGGNGSVSSNGSFTVAPANTDPIQILPSPQGANPFTGTITSLDLTADRTWTFPDESGGICLTSGNCNGVGGNFGGMGTIGYIPKFDTATNVVDSVIYEDGSGNIGLSDNTPSYKLDVNGTFRATGAGNFNSTLDVTGATHLLSTLEVDGQTVLDSTLNVAGATTLSSTLGVTGNTTLGGTLTVANNVTVDTNTFFIDSVGNRVAVGDLTPDAKFDIDSDETTGNAFGISSSTQTSGNMANVVSTSNALTTGKLGNFDWSPTSATTATGDLFAINIGANGSTTGNLFNITDAGSSLFNVSESQITANLPTQFTAPGDVGFAYDVMFTNQTASYIRSKAPLYLEAGEVFESNDLTLRTFNAGDVNIDLTGTGRLNLTGTDTSMVFDTRTAIDTDYWMGIVDDADGVDDDLFQIGKGTVPGTTPYLTLNSSGNLGIGTAAPTGLLNISGGSSSLEALRLSNTNGSGGDLTKILFTNAGGFQEAVIQNNLQSGWGGQLEFGTNSTSGGSPTIRMVIGKTGLIGMGTTAPDRALEINSATGSNLRLTYNDNNGSATTYTDFTTGSDGALTINSTGALNLQSDGTQDVNIAGGSAATGCTVSNSTGNLTCTGNITGASTGTAGFWQRVGTSLSPATLTDRVGIGDTTPDAMLDVDSSETTGNAFGILSSTQTSGNLADIRSTSTALTTGSLGLFDWSPGSATTATGDLLSLNVGSNGTIGNIFNVKNAGSSVFSISQSQITSALPHQFTAPGDIAAAYDLQFTNQTASYIKSYAPLYLEAGEVFESNDLTMRTYNAGNLIADLTGTGNFRMTGTDTSMVFDTRTGGDTDFWMGAVDDGDGVDDDFFRIGDGSTPGSNPFVTISTTGNVGIGNTNPTLLFQAGSSGINSNGQFVTSAPGGSNDVASGYWRVARLTTANHNQTLTLQDMSQTQLAGTQNAINVNTAISPTSGTAVVNQFRIGTTVNQTGGANGITRGIFIDPTLTSAADWRSVEMSNNSGFGIYQSGASALNYFNGNVGIGNTAAGYKLHVGSSAVTDATVLLRLEDANSTCDFTADSGSPSCGSDETLKKNIASLSTSDLLTKVANLRPVSYQWKTDDDSARTQFGFIAQEVAAQFPDLVTERKWVDGTTRKFLNTGGLMPYVVGAVAEQQKQIAEMRLLLNADGEVMDEESTAAAIAAQNEQISGLEGRLNSLEAATATLSAQATMSGSVAGATVINETELDKDRGVIGSLTAVVAEWTDTGFAFFKDTIFWATTIFEGPVAFFNDTILNGRLVIGNRDTAGVIEFYPGQTEAEIAFERAYDLKPIVTLTLEGEASIATNSARPYTLSEVTKEGFKVVLNRPVPAQEIVTINWHALGTAEANITQVGAPPVVASGSGQVAGSATGSGEVSGQ